MIRAIQVGEYPGEAMRVIRKSCVYLRLPREISLLVGLAYSQFGCAGTANIQSQPLQSYSIAGTLSPSAGGTGAIAKLSGIANGS